MTANLKLEGGGTFKVLHCSYSLQRDYDLTGRPSAEVRGGQIVLEVESQKSTEITEWIAMAHTKKNGAVEFIDPTSGQILKELKFTDGFCVQYTEACAGYGNEPMTEQFTVSSRTIEIGNASHDNEWPDF